MATTPPRNQPVPDNRGGSNTSSDTIKAIISFILVRCENVDGVMVPARGAQSEAAKYFGLPTSNISQYWNQAKQNYNTGIPGESQKERKKGWRWTKMGQG